MRIDKDVYLDANKVPNYIWSYLGEAALDMVYEMKTNPDTKEKFEARKALVKKRRLAKC